jgi:glycosyltransferase involved in cell wall biosynthesis
MFLRELMQTKKLLFVTDVFPYPLDRGDRVRILNVLQACAQVFDITLVVPQPEAGSLKHLPQCVSRVVFVDQQPQAPFHWPQYLHAVRLNIGLPFGSMVRYRMQFLQALSTVDVASFDLIWAERPHLGCLFFAHRARTIVDFDDVEHLRVERLIGIQRRSRAKLHNLYRYLVYRRAELRLFRGFLRLIICSQKDQEYLAANHAGVAAIVPNGAVFPLTQRAARRRAEGEPLRLVFLGNMGHAPNDDAVRFFADEVLPGGRDIIASFEVIGPNVSDALRRGYADRVVFRGFVADLATALSDYDVMVAPIRFGGGTKLKIIEAMANGLPLVATPCAAEGLDLVDGTHALLAASPSDTLAALRRLAQSPTLGETLATQAFAHARARFAWESIQAALVSQLRQLP